MKTKLMFACILPILLLSSESAFSQKVIISGVELAGAKVIVHYELEDNNPNNEYLLNLYCSKDNFTTPLAKVKGDVGSEIKPGKDRKMEWSIREEYGGYKGEIALEIRGKVFVPFVKVLNFNASQSYKRGKSYDVSLKAGNTNPIHVELYKGGQRVSGEMNHPNNGAYSLSIPSNAKPGKDYRLKITDSRNSDQVVFTPFFHVIPKIPLLVKILPVVAVGGALAALSGGGGGETSQSTTTSEIVNPPGLPSGN